MPSTIRRVSDTGSSCSRPVTITNASIAINAINKLKNHLHNPLNNLMTMFVAHLFFNHPEVSVCADMFDIRKNKKAVIPHHEKDFFVKLKFF